jgi:predicted RNase H-like nuclease
VLASGCVDQGAPTTVEVISGFAEVLARLQTGSLAAVAVDIPIGLPATGPRSCDVEARQRLGPRRSSVFLRRSARYWGRGLGTRRSP